MSRLAVGDDGGLTGLAGAVLGGDGREVEIARRFRAAGAEVRCHGLPPEVGSQSPSVAAAVEGAQVIIGPIPLCNPDGSLYAPTSPAPVFLDAAALRSAAPGVLIIIGRAPSSLQAAACESGARVREYEHDEELMTLRCPAIAEGAIRLAIEHTQVTLHGGRILVLGFGHTGFSLTRLCLAMGASVSVAARSPLQRARAWELGAEPVPFEQFPAAARGVDVIFSTVPARVLDRETLASLDPETLVIDTAGSPGSADHEAARSLGRKTVWGRGLGARAPRTVGGQQWGGIRRIIREELGR